MVIFVGLKVKKEIRKKIKFKKNIYIALRPPKIGDLKNGTNVSINLRAYS
jgi:hypothetical protein